MAAKKGKVMNNERNLITSKNPRSVISEQFRTIRTNIQFTSVDEEVRTITVTSSGPSEGKSTTAANLAVVFAQQGKRVLIVDADLRKPTAHYTFGMTNGRGLTNVLTRQNGLEEIIEETDIKKLDVLTSGPIPPNPSELLSSKGMKAMIESAKEIYDLIIFDTPPVLAVTDAQLLANLCDGAILVVRSKKTEKEKAVKAKELLAAGNSKILGVILNDKQMENEEDYYYYG